MKSKVDFIVPRDPSRRQATDHLHERRYTSAAVAFQARGGRSRE